MSTSAQRTRRRGAHTKSALGILDGRENCWQHQSHKTTSSVMQRRLQMLRSLILGFAAAAFAAGAQAQAIKIAILGPMAFVQGEHHWAGAEMARDEINKGGGIN